MARPDEPRPPGATPERKARQVPCPNCRQLTWYRTDNPFRPFCSARCKGMDLGAWATEDYRVAADLPPDPTEPLPNLPL